MSIRGGRWAFQDFRWYNIRWGYAQRPLSNILLNTRRCDSRPIDTLQWNSGRGLIFSQRINPPVDCLLNRGKLLYTIAPAIHCWWKFTLDYEERNSGYPWWNKFLRHRYSRTLNSRAAITGGSKACLTGKIFFYDHAKFSKLEIAANRPTRSI